MAKKLPKNTWPLGHGPDDFKCFGPPATKDGEFSGCKLADLGSFSQDDRDSNKYYSVFVCQSKLNNNWHTVYEWGRTGAKSPSFQVIECCSEAEAQREFESQCHEKNDRRGVWSVVAGMRTLTAKPGKDVYLVRNMATRSCLLTDARSIRSGDAAPAKVVSKSGRSADKYTAKLLQDLTGGTIAYTRSNMADGSIPSQAAIDMGRNLLTEAQKRLVAVGDDLDTQIADRELRTLSGELYRRIPKIKPVGTPDKVWILSKNNILSWQTDLDAFESALASDSPVVESDPYHGLPLTMEWVDPKQELGKFLYDWWPKASANKHGNVPGTIEIKNLWKIDRHGDDDRLAAVQRRVGKVGKTDRPLFQPDERPDVGGRSEFVDTNTALLFHGTRSVNLTGIMREGFRMPKDLVGVVLTSQYFGPGVYMADDYKKSVGYTSLPDSHWARGTGGVRGRHAFMFACDVVLGKPHVAARSYPYTQPPAGHHSVFAKGSNHYRENSGVLNNEWMVYDPAQVRIRYLAEFTVPRR